MFFKLLNLEVFIERTEHDYPQWFAVGHKAPGEREYLLWNHRIVISKVQTRSREVVYEQC